jgi:hypothetical protein
MAAVHVVIVRACPPAIDRNHTSLIAAKRPAEILIVLGLTGLNLRGVKESVAILMPIFIAFVITHLARSGAPATSGS